MSPKGDVRWRLAEVLRVVSRAAFLVLVVAFFYQPLHQVIAPRVIPTVQRLFQPAVARGFLVDITSHPPGATVVIDGAVRATTPAILNVACAEGEKVTLTVRKEGFPDFHREFACREGQTLRARIRLDEGGGGGR